MHDLMSMMIDDDEVDGKNKNSYVLRFGY